MPSFTLALGAVAAHGTLSVRGLSTTPTIEGFQLDAGGDAAALRELWPERWPPGLAARGPVTLALRGGGSAEEVHGQVALTAEDVRSVWQDRAGKQEAGPPTRVDLAATVALSRSAGSVKVAEAVVHAGEILVRGEGEVRGLGPSFPQPTLESLAIEASAPAEALLDRLPPWRRPPGVTVRGPLVARLSAQGAPDDLRATVAVDSSGAAVRARGIAKPAGVPLAITAQGRAAGPEGGVLIDRAELRLGTLALVAHGTVRGAEQIDFGFEPLAGGGADVAAMLRLFPEAAERVAEGTRVDGRLAVSGRLVRASGKTTLDVTTRLREASVHRGFAGISGAVDTTAHLEASASSASAKVDVDLTSAILDVVPVIAKRAGRAAHLGFTLAREGERVSVREAHAALPGVTIEGVTAEREPVTTESPGRVHVVVGGATLGLGPLVDMVPLLQGRLPAPLAGATLRFGLDLDGAPGALDAATLRFPTLDLTGGLGHVAGSAQLDGLPPRALHFEVSRGDSDLSGFERPEGVDGVPFDASALHFDGRVHLDSARAGGETVRALDADVTFQNGRLTVGALHLSALGGAVVVENSYLDSHGRPRDRAPCPRRGHRFSRGSPGGASRSCAGAPPGRWT